MRAGFEYYRAFPQDAIQNQNYSKTKLTMPVLAVGGGYIPAFGGNITMPSIIYGMKLLAQKKMLRVLQFQTQVIGLQKSRQIF
jgi:hypothetical protein